MKASTIKRIAALCLAVMLLLALTACGEKPSEAPNNSTQPSSPVTSDSPSPSNVSSGEKPDGIQPGTEFTWWINEDFPLYTPWMDIRAGTLMFHIYDNLLYKYHGDREDIRGNLAETWDVSDDGLVWVFHLKQDAYFTSGNQVNAEAFVKSWDVCKEYQPRFFAPVKSYEATGEFELTVTLNGPSATFVYELPMVPMCSPVDPEALAEYGPEDNRAAVGCGPYYVESYNPGEGFVLKANPDYHHTADRVPSIETVKLTILTDENTATIAMLNGEIDGMKTVNIEVYNTLVESGLEVTSVPQSASPFWFNARDVEIFKDPVVREALCHMIDWDAISQLVYDGLFPAIDSYWPTSGSYPYDDKYTYDPDLGIRMLEEAGYSKDDIAFTMLADADTADLEVAVVAQFQELGFNNIKTEAYDGLTCYGMLKSGTYEMFPCHNGYDQETPLVPYLMGLVPNESPQRCMWLEYMDEAAMDEALEHYNAALVAPDFESYEKEVSEITRICQEQCAAMGGLQTTNFYCVSPEFSGVYIIDVAGYIEFFSLWDNQA